MFLLRCEQMKQQESFTERNVSRGIFTIYCVHIYEIALTWKASAVSVLTSLAFIFIMLSIQPFYLHYRILWGIFFSDVMSCHVSQEKICIRNQNFLSWSFFFNLTKTVTQLLNRFRSWVLRFLCCIHKFFSQTKGVPQAFPKRKKTTLN